jgi:hypothetical protein
VRGQIGGEWKPSRGATSFAAGPECTNINGFFLESQNWPRTHPLVRLAETLGRPGKPTRLMVGLTYLKHSYNLSAEQVCSGQDQPTVRVTGIVVRS